MIWRLVLAVIGFPLALATSLPGEENEVCDSIDCPERKSLLQRTLPHSIAHVNRRARRGPMSFPQRSKLSPQSMRQRMRQRSGLRNLVKGKGKGNRSREACPLDISGVANAPGNAEPLNEAGYENVRACCCPAQMREFIRRLVRADTNCVCHEGGLGGLTRYYYCDDYPQNNFEKLVSAIGSDSDAQKGNCPWVGYGLDTSLCPPQNQDPTVCLSFPGVTESPCIDCETSITTTTTTTAAAKVVSLRFKLNNIKFEDFANNATLKASTSNRTKILINEKIFSSLGKLTPQELEHDVNVTYTKGSLVVHVIIVLHNKNEDQVKENFDKWKEGKLADDEGKLADDVKYTLGEIGMHVTGVSNASIKTGETGPCPSEFPWCNNGFSCELAWCRYYGGCASEEKWIVRKCTSQYVPKCTVPSRVGYDFVSAGGTTTISGFHPSGVICANDYVGQVSYTVCSSEELPYSVSGCQAESAISYQHFCTDCYCDDISGQDIRKLMLSNATRSDCEATCDDDPDCGSYLYYDSRNIRFNCFSCPAQSDGSPAYKQDNSPKARGDIYQKRVTTQDWYGGA